MKAPIAVRVDLVVLAAYVSYTPGPSVETVDLEESGSVAYDVDASGAVSGIEVLHILEPGQIEMARDFAKTRDLKFPRDLTGTVP
jgi:uncharacterized protein YuzE